MDKEKILHELKILLLCSILAILVIIPWVGIAEFLESIGVKDPHVSMILAFVILFWFLFFFLIFILYALEENIEKRGGLEDAKTIW